MGRLGVFIISVCLVFISSLFADMKRYDVQSGKVNYKITGLGTMMGIETKVKGEASLIFKNYGTLELNTESITQNIMGQKDVTNEVVKLDKNVVYSVDEEEKVIYKREISQEMLQEDFYDTSKEYLESMGAKKTSSQKIAGITCDNWELKGIKMCLYKGVVLKSETSILGVTQVKEATKVQFNISLDSNEFNLPNYPIRKLEDMMQNNKMQMQNMSPEEKKMMDEMMKNMKGLYN